ncbi:hypothetical protein PAAG_00085 [Paracoccidioides lutzii Pb01]|uniref:Uncharacterized protein n=1 Tax=Paracoccidioides lutzii (strain ATCC MYA-826 / Pb01) TaxID=502779 RepID=C1GNJ0_PARBA|nr:hypothetical protein PAAG_00085 [Paracoccidioides lutzii Pb01]EEH35762.2 hypothetical protein PAAG_00085 [Paracoccidioides lutzii Pb01]
MADDWQKGDQTLAGRYYQENAFKATTQWNIEPSPWRSEKMLCALRQLPHHSYKLQRLTLLSSCLLDKDKGARPDINYTNDRVPAIPPFSPGPIHYPHPGRACGGAPRASTRRANKNFKR